MVGRLNQVGYMDYFRSKRFLDMLPDWEVGRPVLGPLEAYLPRMRALLKRLGDPQLEFRSVIVGGTNGKGTVSSLLAALLKEGGHRVGLYTSPHLHTQRERIRLDGELPDKDLWADGVGLLFDRTRDFEDEGLGAFSKFEALTGLAALLCARKGMEFGIFEVGLGGRYDATNAWDSELAVLTAVGLDHVEALGSDVVGIAADKLQIAREGRPLFTLAGQLPEVMARIREESEERKLRLQVAGPEGMELVEGGKRPYAWNPVKLPERPRTYVENARLALAVGEFLLGGEFSAERAEKVVVGHQWPGRFERARREPLVLLDGAHNLPGGIALAEDLRTIAPEWTFVVGVGKGHDAAGLLGALQPLAKRVVLTSSAHPRAREVEALRACVPEGVEAKEHASCNQALAETVASLGPEEHLCVTGSLHLVARAREFFGLPCERDGITEEVALESLQCLEIACDNLGLACEPVSEDGNVLRVIAGRRMLYFMRNKNPFNDYVAGRLAEDKGYQYELFTQADLPTPDTMQLFNPLADARFDRYKTHYSIEEIVGAVEERFVYPLVVKKYRSSLAQGVFLEEDGGALAGRLQGLFESSGYLDNIVLIQEFVRGEEYRIVASRDELLLAYGKESEVGEGTADLNPLHQEDGRAVKVEDGDLLERLRKLTAGVAGMIDLGFYAIDLIDGRDGFRILELNPNPFCFFYNRDNGRADFVSIYERLLRECAERRDGLRQESPPSGNPRTRLR